MVERKAALVLASGERFEGTSFGYEQSTSGEVVFATGMTGYPEMLTDPSFKGQILVCTYPLIGNYGIPAAKEEQGLLTHFESDKIQVQALIVADYSQEYAHWSSEKSLATWLKEQHIPALTGIDTRRLTKILREKGTMLGKIMADTKDDTEDIPLYDPNAVDLVAQVTVQKPILYNAENSEKKVVLIDCGTKNSIIRCLLKRNISVLRVPYDYDFFHESFDGIIISNGPGDPTLCTQTIMHIQEAMKRNIPLFGICLGNQLLALAAGGRTYKLKYGHRSQNQPCLRKGTKKCFITAQNHGFAVDIQHLSNEWEEFFTNANDGTNEGIRHKKKPWMSVQFHPEASPGPEDTIFLFDEFKKMLSGDKSEQ